MDELARKARQEGRLTVARRRKGGNTPITSLPIRDPLVDHLITPQAGAQPVSWVSLAGELQRDWARVETVRGAVEIVFTDRLSTA